MKVFVEGIKTPYAGLVKKKEITTKEGKKTFTYLRWNRAIPLAGTPKQVVRVTNGRLYKEVFGGAVVTIEETLPNGVVQATHLPVLNGANQPVPLARLTSRDVGNALSRCRAKAVAMVNGVGLPLYAGGQTDCIAFIKKLGVKPESDLHKTNAVVTDKEEKNGTYIDWPYSLAAARITDPNFHWEVVEFERIDKSTGEVVMFPAIEAGIGWFVAVKVTYKGEEHTEYLPIMGFAEVKTKNGPKMLDHQPIQNPNVHDWNRAVMRCMVKAIAFPSGYGIGVYADEDLEDLDVEPLGRKPEHATAPADGAQQHGKKPAAAPPASFSDADRKLHVAAIEKALAKEGRQAPALIAWLGSQAKDLSGLSDEQMVTAMNALHVQMQPSSATAN